MLDILYIQFNLNFYFCPMQPSTNTIKSATRKKVKNKGWNSQSPQKQYQINNSSIQNTLLIPNKKKYKNITEMSQKYTLNIEAVLGSGFASTVYLGVKIGTNEMVCVKAIDLLTLGISSPYAAMIHQQIQCLQLFCSDFIVQLYDVYQSPTFYYLVMELCIGGDLYKMLKLSPSDFPTAFVENVILQIACGIQQIHQNGFVHRDLKTQNIFISRFPQSVSEIIKIKIGDLGFCIKVGEIQKLKSEGKSIQDVGSPIYMSPEVCKSQEYSFSSDIYSLGIIWYELYHKKAPWQASNQKQLLQKKLSINVDNWRTDIKTEIKQMLLKCINKDFKARPTCTELINFLHQTLSSQTQE